MAKRVGIVGIGIMQQNREFISAKQGIKSSHQGINQADQAILRLAAFCYDVKSGARTLAPDRRRIIFVCREAPLGFHRPSPIGHRTADAATRRCQPFGPKPERGRTQLG
jgi:hypothetical protein